MRNLSLKHTIKQGINGLFHICEQELKMCIKDQGVLIFFLLVPLAYPLVYAFIYTNEVVREVPAAAVDASQSAQSREYLRLVDGSPDIQIVSHCTDMEEAKLLLKQQKIYGIIYIPENFSDDLVNGTQTRISIFADMSGMLYYKALLLANTEASLKMNKDIQIQRAGNTTDRQDEITTQPISYEDVSLYNPQDGFASFLIPAVLILIIQQTLLLGVGLSAGTARENNRFRDLIPLGRHYQGTLRIVFGKSIAYFLIYIIVAAYILCLVPKLFRLVQLASPTTLIIFILTVHFRNLLAGFSYPLFLESCFMDIPIYFRHQRIHPHTNHGSLAKRCLNRIPRTMVASWNLFFDNLLPLSPANFIKPETRIGTFACV